MDPQTIFNPAKARVRRKRKAMVVTSAPAALTLVAATVTFEADPIVRLTFDRFITLGELEPSQISVVHDEQRYVAVGIDDTPSPESVALVLEVDGPAAAGPDALNATAETGIVASEDGGTWAGVDNLHLPFPE